MRLSSSGQEQTPVLSAGSELAERLRQLHASTHPRRGIEGPFEDGRSRPCSTRTSPPSRRHAPLLKGRAHIRPPEYHGGATNAHLCNLVLLQKREPCRLRAPRPTSSRKTTGRPDHSCSVRLNCRDGRSHRGATPPHARPSRSHRYSCRAVPGYQFPRDNCLLSCSP